MLQISNRGLNLVKRYEGCRLAAYLCPAGVWTIGYGHTGTVDGKKIAKGMVITQGTAERLLLQDMKKFADHVNKFDQKYHWTQNEFDAMVSFAFNVGSINQLTANGTRTKQAIANSILLYNKANGSILPGLVKRRQDEKKLFLLNEQPKKEDDEMIEKSKVIVNGREVTVERILKNGTNYIKIRDIANALGMEVSAQGNIPVLKSK